MSVLTQETILPPQENLTLDQFQLMWGDKCGLTPEQQEQAWEDAKVWYVDLPYHNFQHAKETLWESMRLADVCEENGLTVNRKALVIGALFHDAGYFRNHNEEGFETKEEYSVFVMNAYASRYQLEGEGLELAESAIIATTRGSQVRTLEDKILRRADLMNIAGNYAEDFLSKTRLLHKEIETLSDKTVNIWDFAVEGIKILSDFLHDDLSFGEFDRINNRMSVFQFRAIENLKHLTQEIAQETGQRIVDLGKKLGERVMRLLNLNRAA